MILRQGPHHLQYSFRGVLLQVDDDPRLTAKFPGRAANADSRPDSIHIGEAVAHDIDILGIGNQLAQRVRHDPGLDLGAFFGGFGSAAVELKIAAAPPHHRLITAAAEGHFQRQTGVFVQLRDTAGLPPNADGERWMSPLSRLDIPYGVQNRELFLHKMGEILLFKNKQIMIPFGLD